MPDSFDFTISLRINIYILDYDTAAKKYTYVDALYTVDGIKDLALQ